MAEQSNRHLFTIVQRAVEHQQRWLLYMDHCDSCPDSKQCSMAACSSGKATFEHARRCKGSCKFPNCAQLQLLLKHKGICTGQKADCCPICAPVVSYVDRKRKADDSSLYNAPAKKAAAGSNHSAAAAAGTGPASSIMINVEADSLRPDYLRSAGDVSTSSASPLHSLNQGVSGFSAAPRLTLQRSLTTSLKAINLSDLSLSSPTTCGGSVRAVAGSMQKA